MKTKKKKKKKIDLMLKEKNSNTHKIFEDFLIQKSLFLLPQIEKKRKHVLCKDI
jgi:hypothetical protein